MIIQHIDATVKVVMGHGDVAIMPDKKEGKSSVDLLLFRIAGGEVGAVRNLSELEYKMLNPEVTVEFKDGASIDLLIAQLMRAKTLF